MRVGGTRDGVPARLRLPGPAGRPSVLAQGLRDATPARIVQAKRTWKVAVMALAHRLHELGLLTEWGYHTACVQLSRLGYRRPGPAD